MSQSKSNSSELNYDYNVIIKEDINFLEIRYSEDVFDLQKFYQMGIRRENILDMIILNLQHQQDQKDYRVLHGIVQLRKHIEVIAQNFDKVTLKNRLKRI